MRLYGLWRVRYEYIPFRKAGGDAMEHGERSAYGVDGRSRAPTPGDQPSSNSYRTPGPFTLSQYKLLLVGMMARGHGLQALCLFLSMTRDALLDLIVECDLKTPPDHPLRKSGGKYAWREADFPILLKGWLENWSAACIAQQLKRSRPGIWTKARRLGLPRRERRGLHWPSHIERPQSKPEETSPISSGTPGRLPDRWLVRGTDAHIELTSQRGGTEVAWSEHTDALIEIGLRAWAGQRISRIAADFGVSYRTITSQLHWLEVRARPRSEQVDHFDRTLAEERVKAEDYKLGFTKSDPRFPYWFRRRAWTRSRRDVKVGFYNVGFA